MHGATIKITNKTFNYFTGISAACMLLYDALFTYFYVSLSAKETQILTLNSETCSISNADVKNILEKTVPVHQHIQWR
jgi:hypothetical protein